jgi:hypothetical protein
LLVFLLFRFIKLHKAEIWKYNMNCANLSWLCADQRPKLLTRAEKEPNNNCIIVWGPFCWNVSELNRIHIHAQCVNWSAGISYPHCRACPLIGPFCLGFTYCDGGESESERNIIFRCSFIGSFFHIVTSGNVFFFLTTIQKRKNIKTLGNLIYTRGLRPLVQIR